MPYTVYILRNSTNKLYIGQTNNLESRITRHQYDGAKFTRGDASFVLVYHEVYETRLVAMRREKQLKGWRRDKKEALIENNLVLLKKL